MKDKNQIYKYVLALGHGCSDINQSILSAILPFLIAAYHFDYATASLLVMVSNIVGSLVQPVIGHAADKKNCPWIVTLGVSMAGIGMAMTGFTSSFIGLCIGVIISGIGIALFHPQSAKLVAKASAHQEGKGISIFAFGGKLGFTAGPIITAFAINTFGMKGTLIFLAPVVIFGIISSLFMKDFYVLGGEEITESKQNVQESNSNRVDRWGAFWKLCIAVFSRSIITNAMSTFLVLYLINELGCSTTNGNTILSWYYGIAALCTLLGGNLGDRYGYTKIIKLSFTFFVASMLLFLSTRHLYLAVLLLIPLGCAESLSYSPMVVLGQKYLPDHTGFASGITLGLAVSVGAIVCPLLGKLSDLYNIRYAMYGITLFALLALISSLFLTKLDD